MERQRGCGNVIKIDHSQNQTRLPMAWQTIALTFNRWRQQMATLAARDVRSGCGVARESEGRSRLSALYDKISREDILAHAFAQ
jgi:hypothetical protein